jgi:predicted MFS family arabinose efflux permease
VTGRWTVVAVSLTGAVALGLGRFGYTLLLPPMRDWLEWSYAEAGAMNTANGLGYLAGAIAAAPLIGRVERRLLCLAGLGLVCLSLLGCALTGSFGVLLVLRAVAGLAGAVAFVCGAALAAEVAQRHGWSPTLALGLYAGGTGLGIAASGAVVPLTLSVTGQWRAGWLVLGVLGIAGTLVVWRAVALAGSSRSAAGATAWRWPAGRLVPALAAFALFGAGYIAYMTFVIALLDEQTASAPLAMLFWVLLGVTAFAVTPLWPRLIDRLRNGPAFAVGLGTVLAGVLVLLVGDGLAAAFLSALLFGGSFLGVITAAASVAQRSVDGVHWVAAIGTFTTVFAAGQVVGPALAGWVADVASLRSGLALSALLLAAAALLALLQRDLRTGSVVATEGSHRW